MYVFPLATLPIQQQNAHFEDFYEYVFEELSKHDDIEELHVCDNLSNHMIGNVYVKFFKEEQAAAAKNALSGLYYAERLIVLDFSPVTDFREAQHEERSCQKGGYCNFLHLKRISRDLRRKLYGRGRRYGDRDGGRLENDCRRSDRKKRLDRRSRSRSSPSKRNRSREDSVERRAKIELWNREREEVQASADSSQHGNGADLRCQEQVQCSILQ